MRKPYLKPRMASIKKCSLSIEEIFDEAMQNAGFKPLKVGPADSSYQLMSGEEIDLGNLREDELEHIDSLEECINDCVHHDRADYFHVYREAFGQMVVGGKFQYMAGGSRKQIERQRNSPFYKITMDLVARYYHRCFGEEK